MTGGHLVVEIEFAPAFELVLDVLNYARECVARLPDDGERAELLARCQRLARRAGRLNLSESAARRAADIARTN